MPGNNTTPQFPGMIITSEKTMIDLINMKSSVRMMMMTGLKMFVKFPTDSETVYLHILRKNWQKIGK